MAPIKIALRRVTLRHSSKTLKKALNRAANESCVIHLMCQESDFKIGSKFWKWVDLSKYRWNNWHRPLFMHFMMTLSHDRKEFREAFLGLFWGFAMRLCISLQLQLMWNLGNHLSYNLFAQFEVGLAKIDCTTPMHPQACFQEFLLFVWRNIKQPLF